MPSGLTFANYPTSQSQATAGPIAKPELWLSIEINVEKGGRSLRLQEGQAVTIARYGMLPFYRRNRVTVTATTSLTKASAEGELAYTDADCPVSLINVGKVVSGQAYDLPDEQQDLLDDPLSGHSQRTRITILDGKSLCVPSFHGAYGPPWSQSPLTPASWAKTHGLMDQAPAGDVARLPQMLGVVKKGKGTAEVADIMTGKVVEVVEMPIPFACVPAERLLSMRTLVSSVSANWPKLIRTACLQAGVVDIMLGYFGSRPNKGEVLSDDTTGLLRYKLPAINEFTQVSSLAGRSREIIEKMTGVF